MPLEQTGLVLQDMRDLLRKGLGGLDTQDLPDTEADQLLNLSFWDVSDRFYFKEKECRVDSSLNIGKREYPLPNDLDAVITVSVQERNETTDEDTGTWRKLKRIYFHRDDEVRNESTDAQAFPERYHRRDATLVLDPIPDQEYKIRIIMFRTLASLEAGVVDETGLPRNWHEMVVMGAVTRGHFYNQDYNEARQSSAFQVGAERRAVLAQSKEEKYDSRYAGLRVIDDVPDEIDLDRLGLFIRGIPFKTLRQ